MIEFREDSDLLPNRLDVVLKLRLVQNFYRYLESRVRNVFGQEYLTEGASPEYLCLRGYLVVLFKLMHTLVSACLEILGNLIATCNLAMFAHGLKTASHSYLFS